MANVIVQLPLDLTGSNPNNLVGAEEHLLVSISGFAYRIITMEHGGFYTKSLKIYDSKGVRLKANEDFIWTYRHAKLSERTGRAISSAIVFINPEVKGKVFVQAQMVGGNLAYSFTVIDDYVNFQKDNPHTPFIDDYIGTEPIWAPGELENQRWALDKYQPFNNEMENIARAITRGSPTGESDYRNHVKDRYDKFMAKFNSDLQNHLDDKNDPHDVKPADVDLNIVGNYPVATEAEAADPTNNERYLTPFLANKFVKSGATDLLDAHIKLKPANPHSTTAAQMIPPVDTKAVQTTKLNQYYGANDVVENVLRINWRSQWMDRNAYVADVRANLSTSSFPNGMLTANQLTYGNGNARTILRGDGSWTSVEQLQAEYGFAEVYQIHELNEQPSHAAAMNVLNTALANAPLGAAAFYSVWTGLIQGQGNGSGTYFFWLQYVAFKTQAGWQRL